MICIEGQEVNTTQADVIFKPCSNDSKLFRKVCELNKTSKIDYGSRLIVKLITQELDEIVTFFIHIIPYNIFSFELVISKLRWLCHLMLAFDLSGVLTDKWKEEMKTHLMNSISWSKYSDSDKDILLKCIYGNESINHNTDKH